jgi:hypothetical protein
MLIRSRNHWLALFFLSMYLVFAIYTAAFKADKAMVPLYLAFVLFSAITWSSTYTTLSEGILTQRVFGFPYRRFPVQEITRIVPHKKNGKWSYGTVINVFASNGKKLTLQPNKPTPFLKMLHEQAPQAEYLF